jgi:hypothetical protein
MATTSRCEAWWIQESEVVGLAVASESVVNEGQFITHQPALPKSEPAGGDCSNR